MDKKIVKNSKKSNKLNTKVKNSGKRIPDATTLIQINQYNADKQHLELKIGDVNKKLHDVSGLVRTTVLNTKMEEVGNKIPDVCGLVKKIDYNVKISDMEGKYFNISDYNKFTGEICDVKFKKKNLATNNDLNTISELANKNKEKIEKLETTYLNLFLGKIFFDDDGLQNRFDCQLMFNMLDLKLDKGTEYAGNLKVYLNGNFFHCIALWWLVQTDLDTK